MACMNRLLDSYSTDIFDRKGAFGVSDQKVLNRKLLGMLQLAM